MTNNVTERIRRPPVQGFVDYSVFGSAVFTEVVYWPSTCLFDLHHGVLTQVQGPVWWRTDVSRLVRRGSA